MKRSSPLHRSPKTGQLARKTPMVKRNRKRKAKRFVSDFGGAEYVAFIKSLPCAICGVQGFSEAAHVRSRGAGGKADSLVPLCGTRINAFGCHAFFDLRNPTVRAHKERLTVLAAELYAEYHTPKGE
jgi:hypothetical protein